MIQRILFLTLVLVSTTVLGQNTCPTNTAFFDPVTATTDAPVSVSFDLTNFFADADGDELSFTATSNDDNIASASLDGRTLTIDTKSQDGTTFVILTASDGDANCFSGAEVFVSVLPAIDLTFPEDLTNPDSNNDDSADSSTDQDITFPVEESGTNDSASADCPVIANQPGSIEQDISQTLSVEYNLNEYFSDPNGNVLSYSFETFGDDILTINLDGNSLKIESNGNAGFATLFVDASNGNEGCFSSISINVFITDPNDSSSVDVSVDDLLPDTTTPPEDLITTPDDTFTPQSCPTVSGELGTYEKTLEEGLFLEFNLNDYFSDPDGAPLTYSYDVFGDNVVDVIIDGAVLKIASNGNPGFATIFIDANNGNEGCFSSTSLNVFFIDPTNENIPDISIDDLISNVPDPQDLPFGSDDSQIDFSQCPFVITGIEPIITSPDEPKQEVYDLKFFFGDPNDKELTFEINNANSDIVNVALEGSVLTINTLDSTGESFIEIIATNGEAGCETYIGLFVLVATEEEIPPLTELETTFDLSSELEVNLCPEPVKFFEPISIPVGEVQNFTFDLDEYFSDPEGDAFEFDIFNANPEVAYSSLFGSNLTISLGAESGFGFIVINVVGGGNNCIVSLEIPLEVTQSEDFVSDCVPLLTATPEVSLQLDQPETIINLEEYLNIAEDRVFTVDILGTENEYIEASLFGFNLVISVKEIGAGDSAVYLQIKEETSGCMEVAPIYIPIEDPLGLQDTNCPNLKLEFPYLVTLQKGESISFAYSDYFANIDTEGIEFIGAVAFESFATASVEEGVMTIVAKDQVGFSPAAIGVTDAFGLCEIYLPFELQILGEGVTENSCPELTESLPNIEMNDTEAEVSIDLNTYFQDPDGDPLFYGAFIDSNEFVDFNLIDNQLTLYLKQNTAAVVTLEIGASDAFEDCFTTSILEIIIGTTEEEVTNNCPEVVGTIDAISFGNDELLKNISLESLFTDADGDTLTLEVVSDNPEIINAEIQDNTLTVFATPGKTGNAVLVVSAKDQDPYCQSTYNVSVNIPSNEPVVQNTCPTITSGIPPMRVAKNSSDRIILLPELYSDDAPELVYYSTVSYDNSVVTANIEGSYLVLNFSDTNTGNALVELNIIDGGSGCIQYLEFQVEIFEEIENLPPYFESQSFSVEENDSDENAGDFDKFLGKITAIDPEGSPVNLSITNGNNQGIFELRGDQLFLVGILDFETQEVHELEITASDGNKSNTNVVKVFVENVANASIQKGFTLQVYDIDNENTTSKSNAYKRFLNPVLQKTRKGVGKWKVRKNITGGADADKFKIERAVEQKDGEILEDQLVFAINPDFENPSDANGDNIYEVDIEIINEQDGQSLIPVIVSQNAIVVPENEPKALNVESIPATVLQDTDGDGIQDVIDNSPLQFNPGQEDSDGDGVGDVSDDADQDGVWDPFDICPDTPYGTPVNLDGCPIFILPPNNFTISKIEKCIGDNEIRLAVKDTSHAYKLDLTGEINRTQTLREESVSFTGLNGGDYQLCITVIGVDEEEFKRCFDISIAEPEPLTVYSKSGTTKKQVSFDLSGGNTYNITHNGFTKQINKDQVTIDLAKGLNTVRIDTGIECQGVFEQQYFNSAVVMMAPNPARDLTSIFVGGDDPQVNITVYNTLGGILYQTKVRIPQDRRITLPTASLPVGSYYVKVEGQTTQQNLALIKE